MKIEPMKNYNILITNDDGINSPGLRAAVEAVLDLGTVTVAAPSVQQTGAGRGLTGDRQARLAGIDYRAGGREIRAFHCDCSPALVVRHSLQTIFRDRHPDLLISGINYGENLGSLVTSSGTVGAALEGASSGIPGIAVSKQTPVDSHHNYTDQDWSGPVHFLNRFSRLLLESRPHPDIDVLKIDVPAGATPDTAWKITRMARAGYYFKEMENPSVESRVGDGRLVIKVDRETIDPESDIHALAVEGIVSVTPLSLDLTSRVSLSDLHKQYGG